MLTTKLFCVQIGKISSARDTSTGPKTKEEVKAGLRGSLGARTQAGTLQADYLVSHIYCWMIYVFLILFFSKTLQKNACSR